MVRRSPFRGLSIILMGLILFAVSGCSSIPAGTTPAGVPETGSKLDVVADTDILGNVVQQVGGDLIRLHVLIPAGTDPHTYQPAPQDLAQVSNASIVFLNGAGMEQGFLNRLVQNAGKTQIVDASSGITLEEISPAQAAASGEVAGTDPHVFMDPNNVMVWVRNIQDALSKQDPANAGAYKANADAYLKQLQDLDAFIQQQVAQVPQSNRRLVTDHMDLGYFAKRYGFEQVGAIFPSYTDMSEPSAQALAKLEDAIRSQGVKAVFLGNTVNPQLANQVASDTGTKVVHIYTDSLTKGAPAGTYIDLMQYDVNAIVSALK